MNAEPTVDSTSGSSRSNPTGQNPTSTSTANTPSLSQTPRFGKDAAAANRTKMDQTTTSTSTLTFDLSGVQPASRSKRKVPAAIRRQIAADRMAGASIRDLTERYNLARSSVQNILSKEGVPPRRDLIGEQHRAELERLRRQGLSAAQIATRFGVSASTVLRAMGRMGV
ncbi:MAG: helix-turn-helix domain-containing protein [Micrococcales bacterium]|nr:helix-turn-helix domain-containing protein [Micrococcales bacterium]